MKNLKLLNIFLPIVLTGVACSTNNIRFPASDANQNISKLMNLENLKLEAFNRCQQTYSAPITIPIPMLDPPNGGPEAVGMVYQEELAVKTSNLLDQNGFYFSPRPRAAVNTIPMDIYVDYNNSGNYQLKTWYDAKPDYSSNSIQPAIYPNLIPEEGRVLTELILGHVSPKGDWPQLFDLRSSAYVRFAGFPPQVTGASLRLGAHSVFGLDGAEDFPVIRSVYASTLDSTQARALVIVENKLFCGALVMDMSPKHVNAEIVVDGYWYAREDFNWRKDSHTGPVAYSSMYWKNAQQENPEANDSAHDSDIMILKFADGGQKRIPLGPPKTGLDIFDLTKDKKTRQVVEWTLANEDRNPAHYSYFEPALGNTNYPLRVSYNVAILESNMKTGVSLYQQATDGEYGDNIVALSTIRQDMKKSEKVDQFFHFKYKTTAFYPTSQVSLGQGEDQCEFIRRNIQALPEAGGVVTIPAGIYNCRAKIVLKKSHVKIHGAGENLTTLRLANQSHAPVLVIGDDKVIKDNNGNWITATRVTDIEVSDLTVDGNLENQNVKNECGNTHCDGDVSNIRNNAITIRGASYVTLKDVTAHSSISGGLVTEKYCDHLYIKNFTSYGNHFDGFAGYQTEDSLFENVNLSRNKGAGISIDIQFNKNKFLGGNLTNNNDVGIFARNLNGNIFEKLKITNSGNHGAFFAQAEEADTCANNNEFRDVTIEGSKGYGIDIASPCVGNKITGRSYFSKNKSGCFHTHNATTMDVEASVTCK